MVHESHVLIPATTWVGDPMPGQECAVCCWHEDDEWGALEKPCSRQFLGSLDDVQ